MCESNSNNTHVKECNAGICRGKIVPLLLEIGKFVSEENDLSLALDCVLNYMKTQINVARAIISLYHRESGRIFAHKSYGLTAEEQARGIYLLGEGITGKVVESGNPIVVKKIGEEPSFLNRTLSFDQEIDKDSSFICVPIRRGKKVLGTISAERVYDNERLLEKHLDTLKVISNILAQAVELYLIEKIDKVVWEQRTLALVGELQERYKPANIIGYSKPMLEVYALIEKVAKSRTTVLLLGESGVGKEMIANAIHYGGERATSPFIKFNCAALPESIVESELFGHEKGSFTGAMQLRKGRFEEADTGTIFLDEVGDLSLSTQAKLLRVLQEKSFERIGGNKTISVDIRIIAATNKDLPAMVKTGEFREDLYYRLQVFPMVIPPLRERGSDIVTLAEHFVERFSKENKKIISRIATSALNMLMNYSWPGNVRELENIIQRAVILTDDDTIHSYNLPLSLQSQVSPNNDMSYGLESKLASLEYDLLVEALRQCNGVISDAANYLSITRRSMCLRMKKYNLSYKQFRRAKENSQIHWLKAIENCIGYEVH